MRVFDLGMSIELGRIIEEGPHDQVSVFAINNMIWKLHEKIQIKYGLKYRDAAEAEGSK